MRLVILIVCMLPTMALAYEPLTHKLLSSEALKASVLNDATQNVLVNLGLKNELFENSIQQFPNKDNTNQTIEQLIEFGADFEDDLDSERSLHHFYDPVNDRPLDIPGLSAFRNPQKSPDWALEDGTIVINGQDYSYRNAMLYFYSALTGVTKEDRDANWGLMFQSLGQVIHHIQDMSQPDHVRNDDHCSLGVWECVFRHDPSYYEEYTLTKMTSFVPPYITLDYPIPTFPTAREFWTTPGGMGIADFTNRNFFSKDTNFQYHNDVIAISAEYLSPIPDPVPISRNIADADLLGAEGQVLCDELKLIYTLDNPAQGDCYIDFIKTTVSDALNPAMSNDNEKASSLSIFDDELETYNSSITIWEEDGDSVTVDRRPSLNEFNFKAAHEYLIPRAVAYSAGLINHFFRGKIDMIPNPAGAGWVIQNQSDEEMQGTFTLYYDYFDQAEGVEKRAAIPGAVWNETIAPNSDVVVGEYTVPAGLIRKTLVFEGRMGVEDNTVVGSYVGGWSLPIAVPLLPSQSFSTVSDVAIDASNNVMIIFNQLDNNIKNYWSQRYTLVDGWEDPVFIDEKTKRNNLVMDANGNAMLVYDTYDSANDIVSLWSLYYTAGSGWSNEILIENIKGVFSYSNFNNKYRLSMDANGSAVLVYEASSSPNASPSYINNGCELVDGRSTWCLLSKRYTQGSGWGNAVLIENNADWEYRQFNVTMNANGNAVVVYDTVDCSNGCNNFTWVLRSRDYSLAGGWSSATLIESNNDLNDDTNYFFDTADQLAMDENGNSMLVYGKLTGGIWYRTRSSGLSWGAPVLWNDEVPQIGMANNGDAIASFRDSNFNVSAKHYAPSAGWGGIIQFSGSIFIYSFDVEAGGKAVVLWASDKGPVLSIYKP